MFKFLLACCLAFAAERNPTLNTYLILQDGVPPVLNGRALNEARDLLHANVTSLRAGFDSKYWPDSPNCRRYAHVLTLALEQVDLSIRQIGDSSQSDRMSDGELMNDLRTRLLTASIFGLHALFKERREGGFGSLDADLKVSCSLTDRESREREFDELIQNLSKFNQSALGNPGILGFDKMTERLLPLVSEDERATRNLSIKLFAGTVVASIVFWEIAPAAASVVASKLGLSAMLGASPAFIFAVRSTTLGAEGLGYHYLEKAIIPDDSLNSRDAIPTWEEQLAEVERLAQSPPFSPKLYFAYLGQIKSQLAVLYGPWLSGHAKELVSQSSDAIRFKETLALNRENHFLGGEPIENAAVRLPQRIQGDFGYRIRCASGMASGLNVASCLAGLRSFARAVYDGELGKLKVPPVLFQIEVTAEATPEIHFGEKEALIQLPYTLTIPQVAAVVQATLNGAEMSDLVFKSSQFADALGSFEANVQKPVKFDQALTWGEKWVALQRLVSLAKENVNLFDGKEDEILIMRYGNGVRESRLGLQMILSVKEDIGSWRDCLTFAQLSGVGETADRIKSLQDRVTGRMAEIEERWNVSVTCSSERELSLAECYRGLASLKGLLETSASIPFLSRSVIIVSPEEVSGCCQIVGDSQTLALRYTFLYPEAIQFAVKKGWVTSSAF